MKHKLLTLLLSLNLLCLGCPQPVVAQAEFYEGQSIQKDCESEVLVPPNEKTLSGLDVNQEDLVGAEFDVNQLENSFKKKNIDQEKYSNEKEGYLVAPQKDGDITWSIDMKGKLLVTGKGDYTTRPYEEISYLRLPPWFEFRTNIKSAKIKVKNIKSTAYMFLGCYQLSKVNLDNMDWSKVKDTSYMFGACWNLKEINCNKWNVSKVEKMTGMFQNCKTLEKITFDKWKTSSLQYMASMFENTKISKINLNKWDVSKVKGMGSLFEKCGELKSVKVDKWKPKSVVALDEFFKNCNSLKEVSINNWNCKKLESVDSLFDGCLKLEKVSVKSWKTPKLESMRCMFKDCNSLKKCDLSSWKNLEKVQILMSIFEGCTSLESTNVSGFELPNLVNICSMYKNCSKIEKVSFKGWKLSKTVQLWSTFEGCSSLKKIDWDTVEYARFIDTIKTFKGCKNLTCQINISENVDRYDEMCKGAATVEGTKIFINPINSVPKQVALNMKKTKSSKSHVYITGDKTPKAAKIEKISNTSEGVKITWKSALGACGYRIYKKNAKNEFELYKTVVGKSFVDKNANINGEKYQYKIQSYANQLTAEMSKEETVIYLNKVPFEKISKPQNNGKYMFLSVKYKKNPKATGYQIQYSLSPKFTNSKIINIKNSKVVTAKIKKLKKNKTYYFRVRAYKKKSYGNFYSPWTKTKKVKTGK